jgi:hypothetical protein
MALKKCLEGIASRGCLRRRDTSVNPWTYCTRTTWRAHLLEDLGETAALGGGAPAGDGAHGAAGVLFHVGGEADGAHVLAEGGRLGQLQQADVILDRPAVIVLVQLHGLHGNILLHTRLGCALETATKGL